MCTFFHAKLSFFSNLRTKTTKSWRNSNNAPSVSITREKLTTDVSSFISLIGFPPHKYRDASRHFSFTLVLVRLYIAFLSQTPKLSLLRLYSNVVEVQTSKKNWGAWPFPSCLARTGNTDAPSSSLARDSLSPDCFSSPSC